MIVLAIGMGNRFSGEKKRRNTRSLGEKARSWGICPGPAKGIRWY
jgi:hypothetical protein